jgi:hypothetical protein
MRVSTRRIKVSDAGRELVDGIIEGLGSVDACSGLLAAAARDGLNTCEVANLSLDDAKKICRRVLLRAVFKLEGGKLKPRRASCS